MNGTDTIPGAGHPSRPPEGTPTHVPCCSSHGVPMDCARYRRTHFVEVRPCCAVDAAALAAEPPALLDRLDALHATSHGDGRWTADAEGDVVTAVGQVVTSCVYDADAALIAAAVNALPGLTAAVRAVLALADEFDGAPAGELMPVGYAGREIRRVVAAVLADPPPG